MRLKTLLGTVVVGSYLFAGNGARANDSAGISGGAFSASMGSDAPYISHSVGAVYNSDSTATRSAVADLGANFGGGITYHVTVYGANTGRTQTCFLIARNQSNGVATWNSNSSIATGNMSYPIALNVASGAFYSFSLRCDLPAFVTGGSFVYSVIGPN